MLFSVIIPAYNCEKTISDTVHSILKSGLFDFEIVLIDDGSTDHTSQICDALTAQKDCIRCIHQKNVGVSSARNRGIEEARGEYILFFDSDDSVDTCALKHAAELTKKITPDMFIFGLSFDYYYNGKMYRRDELVYSKECLLDKKQWCKEFQQLYQCNALSPVWNKFIKRKLLMENSVRFEKDLIEMEDFVFVIQCMTYCNMIYVLPEAIYRYRQAETERNTFNRLRRISSLSNYMTSFVEVMEQLQQSVSCFGGGLEAQDDVVKQIYTSLFYEQIRFGTIKEIKNASDDMLRGKFAKAIAESNPKLYNKLLEKQYVQVWMKNAISRMRHWIAVRVKYLKAIGGRT